MKQQFNNKEIQVKMLVNKMTTKKNKITSGSNAIQNPEEEKEKERPFNSLLIEDIVTEPRMKFFRKPRLWNYLALIITYNTRMSYVSSLSDIQYKGIWRSKSTTRN